ncbi:Zn-ribbon domain-containing OB-fold protein [Alcaligenes faecalis]|uniref:Zn-ribbon domain-containing OB-fold protein n=1 Tax=Alcaligenes faecalis TaxID=511 RepID=UPI001F0C8D81|nr:OB-fold domain-containing protein [Alcaligenes faecalis]
MSVTESTELPTAMAFGAHAQPIRDIASDQASQFVVKDGAVLLRGSQSRSSGSQAFPVREVCMQTGARDMQDMFFGPFGTLYSFSTIYVSASRPTPYTLGYVDFPNGVRVLAHIRCEDVSALYCDMPVSTATDGNDWFVTPMSAEK